MINQTIIHRFFICASILVSMEGFAIPTPECMIDLQDPEDLSSPCVAFACVFQHNQLVCNTQGLPVAADNARGDCSRETLGWEALGPNPENPSCCLFQTVDAPFVQINLPFPGQTSCGSRMRSKKSVGASSF